MDQPIVTPPAEPPVEPTLPGTPPSAAVKMVKKPKEHWLVEVAGGFALGATMVAALSFWWMTLAFNIFA